MEMFQTSVHTQYFLLYVSRSVYARTCVCVCVIVSGHLHTLRGSF